MNDIDAKERKTGQEKRQQGAMNGTGQRSTNPQSIPIDLKFHYRTKVTKSNIVAKTPNLLTFGIQLRLCQKKDGYTCYSLCPLRWYFMLR
jgi:hypothetical protein